MTEPVPAEANLQQAAIIRRVLVAVDSSEGGRAALEAAAVIAARTSAELVGLHVEDINLIRLSRLPFAREAQLAAGKSVAMDPAAVERWLSSRSAMLRHELEDMAAARRLAGTLRSIRGAVTTELINAARDADIFALGRRGAAVARRSALGSSARAVLGAAAATTLLAQPGALPGSGIALVIDDSATARRAMNLAGLLARADGEVRVILLEANDETALQIRNDSGAFFQRQGIRTDFERCEPATAPALASALGRQAAELVILGVAPSNIESSQLQRLVERLESHILLVR